MYNIMYHYQRHGMWTESDKIQILNFVPFIGLTYMTSNGNFEIVDIAYDPEDEVFHVYLIAK